MPTADPLSGAEDISAEQVDLPNNAAPVVGNPWRAESRETAAHTRTAQLASVIEGIGAVEATSSVAGQPQRWQDDSSVQASPEPADVQPEQISDPHFLAATSTASPTPLGDQRAAAAAAAISAPTLPAGRGLASAPAPAPAAPGSIPSQIARTNAATASDESGRAARSAMRLTPQEPIRLHAEWSDEGVRLWLGMDPALSETLQAITAQLERWLSAQGWRLLSISCNGRPVVDDRGTLALDTVEPDTYMGDSTPAQPRPLKEIP